MCPQRSTEHINLFGLPRALPSWIWSGSSSNRPQHAIKYRQWLAENQVGIASQILCPHDMADLLCSAIYDRVTFRRAVYRRVDSDGFITLNSQGHPKPLKLFSQSHGLWLPTSYQSHTLPLIYWCKFRFTGVSKGLENWSGVWTSFTTETLPRLMHEHSPNSTGMITRMQKHQQYFRVQAPDQRNRSSVIKDPRKQMLRKTQFPLYIDDYNIWFIHFPRYISSQICRLNKLKHERILSYNPLIA